LWISAETVLWSLPLTAGYLLAIPFAVVTASPGLGRIMRHTGHAGIPEDFSPPPEISALLEPGR
jgi:membrane glycosyltransferase